MFFSNASKMELLLKTQDNLAASQNNVEMLATTLKEMKDNSALQNDLAELKMIVAAQNNTAQTMAGTPTTKYTKHEQFKAAYALNLCMISVSQIIDYDDINILEQEYDAILNNLNLEEMPKDEALLSILKQLLDTITFFRIQEGDRKLLEKEYQRQIKDAIWSATPNVGIIFSGKSRISTAISLATQVGIGYMNYRKTKSRILLEKERSEWKLQRSAMEQLNGLRRELFDTAWRLADSYNFPDRYRLTEKQITQYDEILLDDDYLRRYERLAYIQEKFEAYPPFWYYLGNAANLVSQDQKNYDSNTRKKYQDLAMQHFDKFLSQTTHNLLREDQLIASCSLEYFDLVQLAESDNVKKMEDLLDRAIHSAENAYDVWQLCAFSYLQIGAYSKASKIMRMLVNNNYNQVLNAQFLSSMYVADYIQGGDPDAESNYLTLQGRIGESFLFPLPTKEQLAITCSQELENQFVTQQKNLLKEKYAFVLSEVVRDAAVEFNRAFPLPMPDNKLPDDFYEDNVEACKNRQNYIINKFSKDPSYASFLQQFPLTMFQPLNKFYFALRDMPGIDGSIVFNAIKQGLISNKSAILELSQINSSELDKGKIERYLKLSFLSFAENPIKDSVNSILTFIDNIMDMKGVALAESELDRYCLKRRIPLPIVSLAKQEIESQSTALEKEELNIEILGEDSDIIKALSKMHELINTSKNSLFSDKAKKIQLYCYGDCAFKAYVERHKGDLGNPKEILAVINDTTASDDDWLLRTNGIQRYQRKNMFWKALGNVIAYKECAKNLNIRNDFRELLENKRINVDCLSSLIDNLSVSGEIFAEKSESNNFYNSIDVKALFTPSPIAVVYSSTPYPSAEFSTASFMIYHAKSNKDKTLFVTGKRLADKLSIGDYALINDKKMKIESVDKSSDTTNILTLICSGIDSSEITSGQCICFQHDEAAEES